MALRPKLPAAREGDDGPAGVDAITPGERWRWTAYGPSVAADDPCEADGTPLAVGWHPDGWVWRSLTAWAAWYDRHRRDWPSAEAFLQRRQHSPGETWTCEQLWRAWQDGADEAALLVVRAALGDDDDPRTHRKDER